MRPYHSRMGPYSSMLGVLIKRTPCEETTCQQGNDMWKRVLLPEGKKESFPSVFLGSRPCQHLKLGLLTSRTVKYYISVVYTTQVVDLCYSSPSKLVPHSSLISCILESTPSMPILCFPVNNDLFSGHLVHSTCSFWPVGHPSLMPNTFSECLLIFLNAPFNLVLQQSLRVCYVSCKKKFCNE